MQYALKPRVVHGTPITPKALLQQLRGESFCVSFHRPDQIEDVLPLVDQNGILVLDNGAFSHWKTTGGRIDRNAYWAWANEIQSRCEVAVAVIPDVIEGSEHENLLEASHAVRGPGKLAQHPERCMFIWHMNESLEQLKTACRLFNFVGIGSCAQYDVQKNRAGYLQRLQAAKAMIDYVELEHGRRPWIHLMRGLGQLKVALFANSADSVNLAVNHSRLKKQGVANRARVMSNRIRNEVARAASQSGSSEALPTSNFSEGPTAAPLTLSRFGQRQRNLNVLKEAA